MHALAAIPHLQQLQAQTSQPGMHMHALLCTQARAGMQARTLSLPPSFSLALSLSFSRSLVRALSLSYPMTCTHSYTQLHTVTHLQGAISARELPEVVWPLLEVSAPARAAAHIW